MGIFGGALTLASLLNGTFIGSKTDSLRIVTFSTTCQRPHSSSPAFSTTSRNRIWILYSQLSQKQISEDIRERYLLPLLLEANLNSDDVVVEKLSDLGFANNVFKIIRRVDNQQAPCDDSTHHTVWVAKIFSDLAKKRVDPNQRFMGEMDEFLHQHGIGPRIVAHTPDALLMEYIDGHVLTESMILSADNNNHDTINKEGISICQSVGDTLAHMHTLDEAFRKVSHANTNNNMLWHAMDVLLSSIDQEKCQFMTNSSGKNSWSLHRLQDTIGDYRLRLEALDLPLVLGHGDFKTSNVMLTNQPTKEIQFIDFELSGTHYRGYDLAKFFRRSSSGNSHKQASTTRKLPQQQAFWESYYQRVVATSDRCANTFSHPTNMAESVSQLKWEAELLEPMTWLEAASFFLSMATLDDPSQNEKWLGMAQSRLSDFELGAKNLSQNESNTILLPPGARVCV